MLGVASMRRLVIGVLSGMLWGCESLEGSVEINGVLFEAVECHRRPGERAVRIELEDGREVFLADFGRDDIVGIGSGDCIRTSGPGRCVELDVQVFGVCTDTTVEITESGVEREGDEAVDVRAIFDCQDGDETLSGDIEAGACT